MRMPKAEGQARKFISSNQWDLLKCRVLPRRWVCLSVASAAEALDLFEASTRPARCGTCQADRPESVSGCGSCRLELARACEATAVDDRVSKAAALAVPGIAWKVDGAATAEEHAVACGQPMVTHHASTVSVENLTEACVLRRLQWTRCAGRSRRGCGTGSCASQSRWTGRLRCQIQQVKPHHTITSAGALACCLDAMQSMRRGRP